MSTTQEKLAWLRLARSQNVGNATFFRLIKTFGSAQAALEQIPNFCANLPIKRKIIAYPESEALQEIEKVRKFGAEILTFYDDRYPALLKQIPDPAPILTFKGDSDFLNQNAVAIVGTRNSSLNGEKFARKIALELGQNSIITISGMARGIDSAVHEASILSGTVGIIAGGINNIYPASNHKIYQQVIMNGLLISENPFGSPPRKENFVQRNRLISGMAFATIVIEAGLKSGSLITARFAAEQGREVFAAPGSPFDHRYKGTNRLIKDGANMIEDVADILQELPNLAARFDRKKIVLEVDNKEQNDLFNNSFSDSNIKKICIEILQKLSFSPIIIDDLIQDLQVSPQLLNIALMQLELANKIEVNGEKICLSNSNHS